MKALHALALAVVLLFYSCGKEEERSKSALEINYGVFPNDFLAASKFSRLVVEIQYVPGLQPHATTVSRLQTFLQNRLNKPDGVSVVLREIPSPGKQRYSLDDIVNIERSSRTQNTSGNTLSAYIICIDGEYSGNQDLSKVLGVAYYPSSIVLFEKTIQDLSGSPGQPSTLLLESTVSQHEFGHLLGLVNNGTALQSLHQDEPNGKHCNNENCLMYYQAETSWGIGRVTQVPQLDAACLADLKANGGK